MAKAKKGQIADFFLNEAHPYSKKRSIKTKHVVLVLGSIAILVMVAGTLLENKTEHEREVARAAKEISRSTTVESHPEPPKSDDPSYVSLQNQVQGANRRSGGGGGPGVARTYSASQIIKTPDGAGNGLPIGFQVRVQLLGKVESADANSPVTAVLLEDALSPSQAVIIPRGAKIIGNGQLDAARQRLQVRFHTVVFQEGNQYSLSALAMMPDGSSGLIGDFSSGKAMKYASSFAGNFLGGLAEGMKDRQTGGQFGIPFEPGGIKNGVLNGISTSSLGFAKSATDDLGNTQATISVPGGQEFVLYFEREFHP